MTIKINLEKAKTNTRVGISIEKQTKIAMLEVLMIKVYSIVISHLLIRLIDLSILVAFIPKLKTILKRKKST